FQHRNDRGSRHMPNAPKLGFATIATPTKGVLIVLADEGLHFGAATREALAPAGDLVARAAAAERFRGKSGSTLDIVVPAGLKVSRLGVIGIGKEAEARDLVKLGGIAMGKIPSGATEATILLDLPSGPRPAEQAAGRGQALERGQG